jgi:hypothetical protein
MEASWPDVGLSAVRALGGCVVVVTVRTCRSNTLDLKWLFRVDLPCGCGSGGSAARSLLKEDSASRFSHASAASPTSASPTRHPFVLRRPLLCVCVWDWPRINAERVYTNQECEERALFNMAGWHGSCGFGEVGGEGLLGQDVDLPGRVQAPHLRHGHAVDRHCGHRKIARAERQQLELKRPPLSDLGAGSKVSFFWACLFSEGGMGNETYGQGEASLLETEDEPGLLGEHLVRQALCSALRSTGMLMSINLVCSWGVNGRVASIRVPHLWTRRKPGG